MSDPNAMSEGQGGAPTALIVDAEQADRSALRELVLRCNPASDVRALATVEEAVAVVDQLDSLSLFVGAIPPMKGYSIFELRDRIVARFGGIPGAFCSDRNMAPFFDQVRGEMLFYKPIDEDVMSEWLRRSLQVAVAGQQEVGEITTAEAAPPTEMPLATGTATGPVVPEYPNTAALPEVPPPAAAPPEAVATPPEEEDLLEPGTILSDYRITGLMRKDDHIALYEAEQISIERHVRLKTLYRRHRRNETLVGAFADEARSRALVSHPDIAVVYEADQQGGFSYYAIERMSGPTLEELARNGAALGEDVILGILLTLADVLEYLKRADLRLRLIRPSTIHLLGGEKAHIANPVSGSGPSNLKEVEQLRLIGTAVRPFFHGRKSELAHLVDRLGRSENPNPILTVEGFVKAMDEMDPVGGSGPVTAEEKEKQKTRMAVVVGGVVGALIVIIGIGFLLSASGKPQPKEFDYMVKIPEGPFHYQEGETVHLDAFWIDEHEVTIHQYAKFLEDIAANPQQLAGFEHPNQPADYASHQPPEWERYYPIALKGGKYGGAPIDVNCPVMQVTYWDAYAYAKWKGGRLPTEEEWEKAARGRSGNLYPWGNEFDERRFNSGADQERSGLAGAGRIDGFRYWSPVDAFPGDESRYGVKGMAGNVTEWTDSWVTHPEFPDQQIPMRRGASFLDKEGFELTQRRYPESASDRVLINGFRTVRDSPPQEGP